MNGFLRLLLIFLMSLSLVHCVSTSEEGDADAPATEADFDELENSDSTASASNGSVEDEINQAEGKSTTESQAATETPAESSLEDEFAQFDSEPQSKAQDDSLAQQNSVDLPPAVETPIEPPPPEIAQPSPPAAEPAPLVVETPPAPEAPAATDQLAQIKNIKYKANDNGGTIVVEASSPLTFETRNNRDTNQFIIEIPNASLPAKLKRPFNTKDMQGGVGSIDAYQNKGSTTARIVVQLREGVAEPTVESEGNSLLIVQTNAAGGAPAEPVATGQIESVESGELEGASRQEEKSQTALLSASSLEEFISGNTKFYGKKISLEVSEMDIREVFRLIGEESGINLVVSDDVKGTVTLKLREVPWDQALVVILKARKLGYTRAGNILRIAPLVDLKAEEEDSIKLANTRKTQTPLSVRVLPISYAKIKDLETQIKSFLSERGKVVSDERTSSIVISDLDENIDRVAKLIKSIDVPPMQVLIEGKVVEASDTFQRTVGVNWSARLPDGEMGINSLGQAIRGSNGVVNITPSLGSSSTGSFRFNLGTLDILGDLNATLSLFEAQNAVKILSSPRVVTIHNEPAEIMQNQEVVVQKETILPNGTISRTPDFRKVVLKMNVTPQITNDASVILAVDVNRDFVAEATTGALASRSAKTRVMVRNAQTAVIGGIYQQDQNTNENKVPWVGDVPVLGWLFKSKTNNDQKNELLIFLTPRILGQTNSQSIPSQMKKEEDLEL
ncbi:MAG: type IV pilus secretin PilQ [Pseudobdellovibrionaceae bacterium]